MTVTIIASPTLKISEKQFNYIRNLALEKSNWADTVDGPTSRVIKFVTRATEYLLVPDSITRADGSKAIDFLIKLPKATPIITATTSAPAATTNMSWQEIKSQAIALLDTVPAAYKGVKYAIKNTDAKSPNTWVFYEVKECKGKRYLNRLLGAPGGWNRQYVKYADYANIVERIKNAVYTTKEGEHLTGPMAAAARFSDTYEVCACCGAKLSNGKSIAAKFGPVCVKKF